MGLLKAMVVRNVCDALPMGIAQIQQYGRRERSRGGDVLVLPGPMITETSRPTERVLFSAVRDANPFFHLAESMWMLAGQQDARPLDVFVGDFSKRFAEDGGVMHGAYGHRWRHHFLFDQLNYVCEALYADPTTRQVVLTMWDPSTTTLPVDRGNGDVGEDLYGGADLTGVWKDRPCNTHAYFRVRFEPSQTVDGDSNGGGWDKFLDMTVCCRSNDIIWGAHGANAVHFSILQEYVAARTGCQVGVMVQLSNNYHAYAAFLDIMTRRVAAAGKDFPLRVMTMDNRYEPDAFGETDMMVTPEPMFTNPGAIDDDVGKFWRWFTEMDRNRTPPHYANEWFATTLEMMMLAHFYQKKGSYDTALNCAREVDSPDWSVAAVEWLERRNNENYLKTGAANVAAS